MSAVIERQLNLKSVQTAWQGLNKLVPLGRIASRKDYALRVGVMDELLDHIGNDESHSLMPLLDLITRQIEAYEAEHHALPDAPPAAVLAYLMQEQGLTQTDLAEELGGQSIVSAILNGKRDLNTRQVKTLSKRFKVSPEVFL